MYTIKEIQESNYQDYTGLDIVAFSFAFGGAMGEGGGIYIIDRDGQICHANYCDENISIEPDHIKTIIPFIEDIDFGILGNRSKNDNYESVYLGYGNHLVMNKNIYDGFCKKVEEAKFHNIVDLFQCWPGFVLDLIGKGNSHLTMSDIWEMIDSNE